MAATNVCLVYITATIILSRVVIPDRDSQVTLGGGPCTALGNESVLLMPMATWLATPTMVAAQAYLNAHVNTTRNFLIGVYNYSQAGNQTPYHSHLSAGPTATGLTLGYRPDHTEQYQTHTQGGGFNSLPSTTYPEILSVDISSQGTNFNYTNVMNGVNDAQFNTTFNSALSQMGTGKIYYFMIDKEFQFQGTYTNFPASTYRAAVSHVINLGKAIFGTGVGAPKYCWNPNFSTGGDISNLLSPDVDIIGIDAYTNTSFSTASAQIFGNTNGTDAGTLWFWTKVAQANGMKMAICEGGDAANAGTPDAVYYNALFDWAFNVTTGTWGGASSDNGVVDITLYEAGLAANQSAANASVMSNAQYDALVNRLRVKSTYGGAFFTTLPTDTSLSFM